MILNTVFDILFSNIRSISPLEIAGVFFGLVSVLYERKGNILVFPTGMVSVLIYVYLCFRTRLYADVVVNLYYFVVSIYGWYFWSRRNQSGRYTLITRSSRKELLKYLLIVALSYVVIYVLLKYFTDSDVAIVDSLTTSLFFAGMLLMARKKIENWIAWMVGNFICIPLYFYKGLVLTSLQFLVFFILSVSGWYLWKRMLREQAA